jgi:hypothetical protein
MKKWGCAAVNGKRFAFSADVRDVHLISLHSQCCSTHAMMTVDGHMHGFKLIHY